MAYYLAFCFHEAFCSDAQKALNEQGILYDVSGFNLRQREWPRYQRNDPPSADILFILFAYRHLRHGYPSPVERKCHADIRDLFHAGERTDCERSRHRFSRFRCPFPLFRLPRART